jgi:undecaprenyl-diphosphatase
MRKQFFTTVIVILTLLSSLCLSTAAESPGEQTKTAAPEALTIPQAVVLGIVEGLTEYLPVSSTGHLLLAEKIMGIGEDPHQVPAQREQTKAAVDAYTICIQAGAILAVLWLYWGRIIQILRGVIGRDTAGRHLLVNVLAGFLPAAVLGLLFNKLIKSYLFGPWPVVFAWLVGGLAILAVSRRNRARNHDRRTGSPLDDMTWRMAMVIGFAQCIAMWPGVSRSLVTIVGGLLVGLTMEAAVEYSFLLGVVTLGAATAYDTLKHGQLMLQTFDHLSLFVGVVVALVAAVVSVKWMVSYLSRHGLAIFGYYRVFIAVVTTIFLLATNGV